ncbi:MAG: hypothetical protein K2Q12_00905 [Rickettsiales bacterium]|nr:hypothetical protein [Rickettsiales bacterium]
MTGFETALLVAGTVASVAGTAVSAVGQANNQKAQSKYSMQQAELERRKTRAEERVLRRRGDLLRAEQRVGYAGGGVALEGSALDVLSATASEQERDIMELRYGGQTRASGYETNSRIQRSNATGSLLGGAFDSATTAAGGVSKYLKATSKG